VVKDCLGVFLDSGCQNFIEYVCTDIRLISKIYKELKKLTTKKPNNPIKNWSIELNREFTTEES
jgi:hypothetical protein